MSILLRAVGGAMLLGGAIFASRAYGRYAERRLEELEGFTALLSRVRERISVYLTPQSELLADFECPPLEACGFMSIYRESGSLLEAFRGAKVSIVPDAARVLSSFFESFGRGYKSEELARVDSAAQECTRILERERTDLPRDVRLAGVLISSAALAVFILII